MAGERSLTSAEYQQLQRWQILLTEFMKLDLVHPPLRNTQAISLLQQLAADITFQPQSEKTTAVQIMGGLEAAGLNFDYLWIMGADDQNWPPSQNVNPFIPFKLQYLLEMPHANAERELNFYRSLTERLINSAQQTVFSYPLQDGDEALRPSPLIQSFAHKKIDDLLLPAYQSHDEILLASPGFRNVNRPSRPHVSPG